MSVPSHHGVSNTQLLKFILETPDNRGESVNSLVLLLWKFTLSPGFCAGLHLSLHLPKTKECHRGSTPSF